MVEKLTLSAQAFHPVEGRCQTPDFPFHVCRDFWFSDGNVILTAGPVAFKVHRGQLERHAEIFQTMLSIPQPDNADSTIHLCDSPTDVYHLLRALYDGLYVRNKNASDYSFSFSSRTDCADADNCSSDGDFRAVTSASRSYRTFRTLPRSSAYPASTSSASRAANAWSACRAISPRRSPTGTAANACPSRPMATTTPARRSHRQYTSSISRASSTSAPSSPQRFTTLPVTARQRRQAALSPFRTSSSRFLVARIAPCQPRPRPRPRLPARPRRCSLPHTSFLHFLPRLCPPQKRRIPLTTPLQCSLTRKPRRPSDSRTTTSC